MVKFFAHFFDAGDATTKAVLSIEHFTKSMDGCAMVHGAIKGAAMGCCLDEVAVSQADGPRWGDIGVGLDLAG